MWPRIKYLKKKILHKPDRHRNSDSSEIGDNTRSSNLSTGDADKPATGKVNTTNKQVLNDRDPLPRCSGPSPSSFQSQSAATTSQQGSQVSGKMTSTKSASDTGARQQPWNLPSSNDHCNVPGQESTVAKDAQRPFVGEVISTGQTRTKRDRTPSIIIQTSTISEQGGHFTGAHDFTMNYPTLIDTQSMIQNNQNTYFMSGQPVLMLLKSAGTPEAALDAGARYPPPRCHPGTRKTIQEILLKWLLNLVSGERMIWLFGPAGVGKSAVAQSFAEGAQREGRLGSTFFFSSIQGERRSDPLRVVPTLAYHLAICNKQYQHVVSQRLASDPSVLDAALNVQFQKLIIEPFADLASLHTQPDDAEISLLVVIDGLDECRDEVAQCELIELIREAARRPEIPLVWLVCSRPEPHITYTFSQLEFTTICMRHKLTIDDEARADVERFLHDRFREIYHRYHYMIKVDASGSWPSKGDFEIIAKAADGHFIVAATAERFIGDQFVKNPQARLCSVVSMLKGLEATGVSNPLEALDAFYSRILAKVPEHAWPLVVQVLGLCAHNLDRVLSYRDTTKLTNTKHLWLLLRTDQAQFYGAMETLHSVLDIPPVEDAPNKPLAFYHKSFPDYLTNAQRSGRFFVSRLQARRYHLACALHWCNLILQYENQSCVSADEYYHAESMLREWFSDRIDKKFKIIVFHNIEHDNDTKLWDNIPIDDFHFDLIDDSHSDFIHFPMFLVREDRASSHFVRTEIKDNNVDPRLLHHLSLLTNGKPVEPLDITATKPFKRMKKKSAGYFIIGNGSRSSLACISYGLGDWKWDIIWLNSALPPTEEQRALYQKWDNQITGLLDKNNSSSDEDSGLDDLGDSTEDDN